MAFAITGVRAEGIEVEEALNKRYYQKYILSITALAADVALDVGSFVSGALGTFWTAAGGSTIGAQALVAIRDISTKVDTFDTLGGSFTLGYSRGAAVAASVSTVAANSLGNTPNIAFNAANGPTSYDVVLTWALSPGNSPTQLYNP